MPSRSPPLGHILCVDNSRLVSELVGLPYVGRVRLRNRPAIARPLPSFADEPSGRTPSVYLIRLRLGDWPIFRLMRDRGDRKAGKLLVGGKALALLRYHEEPQPLPLVAAFTGLLTGFSCAFAILVRTRHSIETPQRKESSPSLFWQRWTFSGCVPSNPVPLATKPARRRPLAPPWPALRAPLWLRWWRGVLACTMNNADRMDLNRARGAGSVACLYRVVTA